MRLAPFRAHGHRVSQWTCLPGLTESRVHTSPLHPELCPWLHVAHGHTTAQQTQMVPAVTDSPVDSTDQPVFRILTSYFGTGFR